MLYPLFFGVTPPRTFSLRAEARETSGERDEAVAVLREIEFDRATGKLADADYAELKAQWTERALVAMRAADAGRATAASATAAGTDDATLDPAERAIRRARAVALVCPEDGPRPETDAVYCSDCGRWLAGTCISCGATINAQGARYCTECGTALAA